MDLLVTDPVSGKNTGLAKAVRRALAAIKDAQVPYCVIGATALAVRGLPRMTRDLDLVVMVEDGADAVAALRRAGFRAETPVGPADDPEPMVVFVDPPTGIEVDLRVAAGDPEATALERATVARVFGTSARVATLESLLLLYLYSNQPKHLGDFASIVVSGHADLRKAERALAVMHPEMLRTWKRRVEQVKNPPPAPKKPPRRPR